MPFGRDQNLVVTQYEALDDSGAGTGFAEPYEESKLSGSYNDAILRFTVPDGDHLNQHKIDGKLNPASCFPCHGRQNNERCKQCHR